MSPKAPATARGTATAPATRPTRRAPDHPVAATPGASRASPTQA